MGLKRPCMGVLRLLPGSVIGWKDTGDSEMVELVPKIYHSERVQNKSDKRKKMHQARPRGNKTQASKRSSQ